VLLCRHTQAAAESGQLVQLSAVSILLPSTDVEVMYDLELGRVDASGLPDTSVTQPSAQVHHDLHQTLVQQ
jgi:hypothetical protein